MRAGLMRWTVNIEKPSTTQNALNETGNAWVTVQSNVRCRKKKHTGQEKNIASGEIYHTVWHFYFRFIADFSPDYRLIDTTTQQRYAVIDIEDINGRSRELRVNCLEQSREPTGL